MGTVTVAHEEYAKRKIAKATKRGAAKAAGQPAFKPVARCAGQQNPILAPAESPRLGLARLKQAAVARRRAEIVAGKWRVARNWIKAPQIAHPQTGAQGYDRTVHPQRKRPIT